jgi:hypothetical protein
MDINLNKFTGTNFVLVFPKLPSQKGEQSIKPLTLNIFSTVLPSVELSDATGKWMAGSMKYQIGDVSWGDWNVDFIVDSKLENWKLLYNWIIYINNNKDSFLLNPKDYQVDVSMLMMDNFENVNLEVVYRNVWINSLGNVDLSYRDGDAIIESSAKFSYDRFEIK